MVIARSASMWFVIAILFSVLSEPCPGQTLDFSYTLSDATIQYDPALGTGSVALPVYIQEHPTTSGFPHNVAGWSMSVRHDPTHVDVTHVAQGAYIASLDNGNGPDFFSPNVGSPNGFTVGCVYDFFGLVVCTYEIPKEVVVATFVTLPGSLIGNQIGVQVLLEWFPMGNPPISNHVVVQGMSNAPTENPGSLTLQPIVLEAFVRGDADGSLGISALVDAVTILGYLFNGQPMNCLDAADFDDDGAVNLVDPISLLSYGFVQGPPPAAPFPGCGSDPTADAIDCAVPPCP